MMEAHNARPCADIDLGAYLRSGDTLLWGQATAEPLTLTRALVSQRHTLGRLTLMLGIDLSRTLLPEHADCFDFISYCGAGGNRALANADVLDILPGAYSTLPALLRGGALKIDAVLIQVSPADQDGYHSLGLANDLLIAALDIARVIIAEVNPGVPYSSGVRRLHVSEIDLVVQAQCPPLHVTPASTSAIDTQIAAHVAALIDDGATLQLGLGGVANSVLAQLTDRRDLGIHSGIVGDGLVDLAESGALTNARKTIDRGVTVSGLLMGSQRLYDYAHNNPLLKLYGSEYTHAPEVLRSLERFVAINSAIEVDLTGQINAEMAAGQYVGAVGGAPDFTRAALLSKGGIPIVALPATAGIHSRIVSQLSGPVTIPRCDAGVIVTEYGVADLRGLSLKARARKMLDIAAPEHRAELERQLQIL
jgi:acetyl-CoA hydrolase